VIYLDFQQAFDKVPHKRLMMKINAMGITGDVFNWIEDWLNDREQRVVLLGAQSEWIKLRVVFLKDRCLVLSCSSFI